MSKFDISKLKSWIGKQEIMHDIVSLAAVKAMSATLDQQQCPVVQGDHLPGLWHWLYFSPAIPASDIAKDGHQKLGKFLPPVPLKRRMWAGSQLSFHHPIKVGDELKRISTIKDITQKQGRTGQLVFVTVCHDIFEGDKLAISEQQNIVYRDVETKKSSPQAKLAPEVPMWSREVRPDAVLLFRYSALTFNSHRIHYDRSYAMGEEGYDGLVVHGPLTATLLLDLLYRELPGARVQSYQFRGVSALFDFDIIKLQGRRQGNKVSLWALNGKGELAMTAEAILNGAEK